MASYAVGIDLGGTNLKAALVERDEGLCETTRCPTEGDRGPAHVVDRIADVTQQMMDAAPSDGPNAGDVIGVGVGSPGTIDWERTTVSSPPNLADWDTVNLREELQARLGQDVVVYVENDANVAGLGSAYYGAGRPHDSFLMVTLGTGVGGAIIYQNRIFRGATGGAGEIGHMTINYAGPMQNFGIEGAIEGYLGQRFLSHHARLRLRSRDSLVHDLTNGDLEAITPRTLYDAATQGDEPAQKMLAWAGHKLGIVCASAVNLLDIRTIIVGGGVSAAGDFLLDPAREALYEFTIPNMHDGLGIIREELGNEVSLLGAARLAFDGDDAQV